MSGPLAPWIGEFTRVVSEELLVLRRRAFEADTATIHQGRRIEHLRMAAFLGYQRYEPEEEPPCGD